MINKNILDIKAEIFVYFALDADGLTAITVKDGVYSVHQWTKDSVAPVSEYSTTAKAASRVIQLLGLGPTTPQDHPEVVKIETLNKQPK